MCPEDVSFVVRYVLCEFFMLHGTELLPGQVKIVKIDSNQGEFFYGPLDPVFDVGDIPLRRIWRKESIILNYRAIILIMVRYQKYTFTLTAKELSEINTINEM